MSASGAVMMRLVKLVPAAVEPTGRHAGSKDQLLGCGRRDRPAVRRRAGSRSGATDIERICRVEAAVFRGADVDERCRHIECDCHGVCPRGRGLDVLGVVDRLAKAGAACRRDGNLIGVPCGIGDRGDVRCRVVPPDREDIGIPRHLCICVGHADLGLIGLRRGRTHLYERGCVGVRYGAGAQSQRRVALMSHATRRKEGRRLGLNLRIKRVSRSLRATSRTARNTP